jgi:hypothetical protein
MWPCVSGIDEVDDNVEWATLRVAGKPFFWLALDVIDSASETGKGGKKLEDSI